MLRILAPPYKLLLRGGCCVAPRVCRLLVAGWSSTGTAFVRDDFLRPPSTKEEGPSMVAFFQGGDSARGRERRRKDDSSSFRLLFGPSLRRPVESLSFVFSSCCLAV